MRHLVLAVALMAVPAAANAVTIDFESLGFDGDTNPGPRGISSPLVIGDYSFTATDPFGFPPILVYARQSTNNPDFGGTSILPNRIDPGITIARTDGAAFTFTSLDLTFAYDDQNGLFEGGLATYTFGGTGTAETRAFDNLAGFQTFTFNAAGVTSVRISGDSPFAIDNVVLSDRVAAVPEPASWAMMIVGFGAIGAAARRRQRVAVRFG
jgi:hypothetical protein